MAQTLEFNKEVVNATAVIVPTFDEDMDIIQKLDDEPNDVGGLSAEQLKAEFDSAGNKTKDFINNELIPSIIAEELTEEARAAAEAERVANEQERVSNENERIVAEEKRETEILKVENLTVEAETIPSDSVASAEVTVNEQTGGFNVRFSIPKGADGKDGENGQDGNGDMKASVYDPQGKAQDVFAYTDNGLAGKAPAGFGLGENTAYAPDYDWNKISGSGYYIGSVNAPDGAWWIGQHIESSEGIIQFARRNTPAVYCVRSKVNGEWQPWEYINPPMELGVEYRTTERYLGKPVYARVVDVGNVAAGASATVSFDGGTRESDCIVSANLFVSGNNQYESTTTASIVEARGVGIGTVTVKNHTSSYAMNYVLVFIKYTKTTD